VATSGAGPRLAKAARSLRAPSARNLS
jgi:hypothetical protein